MTTYRRYTLRELRALVRDGYAINLTNADHDTVYSVGRTCTRIGYSTGIYGLNGGLVETPDGTRYAIIGRSSNLFILF